MDVIAVAAAVVVFAIPVNGDDEGADSGDVDVKLACVELDGRLLDMGTRGEAPAVTVRVVVTETKLMDSALADSFLTGEGCGQDEVVDERSELMSVSVVYLDI
ncbi:predicted protein [Histoplasma capsulatum G186AR]|uniref:Secreted protein n=2 Tax=Ajellomyces capsulatus TaxID=5037 RepID=C0NWH3_AJECG|nr:uncharacterized protein HCBG_07503 [Histoplasma capsulatum G186AR]EEH04278.1 predicted protein [Histoplasma capsulatum G186AR]